MTHLARYPWKWPCGEPNATPDGSHPARGQCGEPFSSGLDSSAYAFSRYRQAEDQLYRIDNPRPDSGLQARHDTPGSASTPRDDTSAI